MQKRTHLQTRTFVHTLNGNCKTFIMSHGGGTQVFRHSLEAAEIVSSFDPMRLHTVDIDKDLEYVSLDIYKTPKSSVRQFANSLCVCFQWFIPKVNRATYKNESKLFPIMLIGFKVFH